MGNAYNQFIQAQMRNEQPDKEKLIKIAFHIGRAFSIVVQREAILLFDREDGHLVTFASWITKEQFYKYIIHVPDLLFFLNNTLWIMEIDGWIHNVKNRVIEKDKARNECYRNANMHFELVNEWEVMLSQGINPDRSATAKELIPTVKKRIEKMIMLSK